MDDTLNEIFDNTKVWAARDCDGRLFLYTGMKPYKNTSGQEVWVGKTKEHFLEISKELFPEVKWEDEEPCELKLELK